MALNKSNIAAGDPLQIHASDHPGMILVSTPLTGLNYRSWSRGIQIALGAKNKLGFVNGEILILDENSEEFNLWKRYDYMVTSWLLNLISKDLVDAFIYTNNARQLWREIEERFGESNGALVYQLQRKISSVSQDNFFVSVYYTQLKRLWDELATVKPLPNCSCGASKAVSEFAEENKLMQFLMGLHDGYD
ncbi:uncharacterized protein LOC127794724 [Diospyros lotus]|uniref:uncharacterized protein LOC127794724 n=1 Tax=Diospyros lotus TaxID=55363 RepID=UPI00225A3730|nr:uncharacterized protein LOC127794724 [Diospyros lotus]